MHACTCHACQVEEVESCADQITLSCTVLCCLGAALANIFTAAFVVPKKPENQQYEPKFGALCTLGQPRVGNAAYSNTLENILSPNRMHRRCDKQLEANPLLPLSYCPETVSTLPVSAAGQAIQYRAQ